MSMNTHVIGFKAPNELWKKMKTIWDSCTEAGIDPPKAVEDFFEGAPPDDAGVEIELEEAESVTRWNADMQDGFVVDVKKLLEEHPDITHIRFFNSY